MNKINVNKKGILLSEGIRIILAVIALVLLIYLAVQLSGIFLKKNAQEQAKEGMKRLMDEIKAVEKGDKNEAQLFIESPNDWWIIAWPYKTDVRKPKQCKGNYCLCICPVPGKVDTGKISGFENSLNYCNSIGVCTDVNQPIKTIYESQTGSLHADVIRSIINFFGGETTNVPIDINRPLPVKIKLVNNEIQVIK